MGFVANGSSQIVGHSFCPGLCLLNLTKLGFLDPSIYGKKFERVGMGCSWLIHVQAMSSTYVKLTHQLWRALCSMIFRWKHSSVSKRDLLIQPKDWPSSVVAGKNLRLTPVPLTTTTTMRPNHTHVVSSLGTAPQYLSR